MRKTVAPRRTHRRLPRRVSTSRRTHPWEPRPESQKAESESRNVVVVELGVARPSGLTPSARAAALIAIAHPEDREKLERW
jgi:hypothetical protein